MRKTWRSGLDVDVDAVVEEVVGGSMRCVREGPV